MSDTKTRRPLAEMQALADRLVEEMRPTCERIEIAGSIRRGRADVGDIEIVAIPREHGTPLGTLMDTWQLNGAIVPRTNARGRRIAYGPKYRAILWHRIPVDLFLTTPDQWGLILLIRTGPGAPELGFERWPGGANQFLVTQRSKGGLLPDDLMVSEGRLWRGADLIVTPEEIDVYRALGLPFVEPGERSITTYKRLLAASQQAARSASQGQPAPAAATPRIGRDPIARDYWFAAPAREKLRDLAAELVRAAKVERPNVLYLDYQGQDRRWYGCVTIRAQYHDAIRVEYFKLLGGNNALS